MLTSHTDVLEMVLAYVPAHRSRRDEVSAELIEGRGGECQGCGYAHDGENGHHFDWHHRDPTEKLFSIGSHKDRRAVDLAAEVAKCDLLCKFCHVDRHKGQLRVRGDRHTAYWAGLRQMKRLSVVNMLQPRGGLLRVSQNA